MSSYTVDPYSTVMTLIPSGFTRTIFTRTIAGSVSFQIYIRAMKSTLLSENLDLKSRTYIASRLPAGLSF